MLWEYGIPKPSLILLRSTSVLDWCNHSKAKSWISLEQAISPQGSSYAQVKVHPLLGTTYKIVNMIKPRVLSAAMISPTMPVIGNPDFTPGLFNPKMRQFIEADKCRIQDFRESK